MPATRIFELITKRFSIVLNLIFVVMLFCPNDGQAKTLYVDPSLISSCISTYDSHSRSCGGGQETAYVNFSGGIAAAHEGDTVLLRSGQYSQISISKSGQTNQPISIKAYPSEDIRISNLSGAVALWLVNVSNISIEGIVIENVLGFGRLENSHNISISNIRFSNASSSGTTGALKLVKSTYNRIERCSFTDGSDLMVIQDDSNHNIVHDNSFENASHSLISIRCSSLNVIRGNTFSNKDQKAVEIYDCEGVSDAPVRLDATKRNLIELNNFILTAASDRDYRYNAIQHGGQQTIVRNNVFRNCLGGGVNYQYYSDESIYVYQNRLYNNTFYNNRCYGIIGAAGSSSRFFDNQAKNNLLYKNSACDGGTGQTSIENSNLVILTNNALSTVDPKFQDLSAQNFSLASDSPYIDAGIFVTATSSAGSGNSLGVQDAKYFYDGFGIPGESGDVIQLQGQSDRATVVNADVNNNVLTLSRSMTWNSNQGVNMAFTGSGPDMGAYEFNYSNSSVMTPQNLRVLETN